MREEVELEQFERKESGVVEIGGGGMEGVQKEVETSEDSMHAPKEGEEKKGEASEEDR